jgi:hypothetical protein
MTEGGSIVVGSLLASFLKGRKSGIVVILIGLGGYILACCLLPDLADSNIRKQYEPFFVAGGALTAGLFVTLAVASREITSDVLLGIVTVCFVGTAALGAVLALLPAACSTVYSMAFVALVGGGLASLISTALIASVALLNARAEQRDQTLQALQSLQTQVEKLPKSPSS